MKSASKKNTSAKPAAKNTSAKPAAKAAPAAKPAAPAFTAEDIAKDRKKGAAKEAELSKALMQAISVMKPADPPAAPAEAKPAAPAAPKPAAPAKDTLSIHVNNTGRVCFAKDASARLKAAGVSEEAVKAEKWHIAYSIENGLIRFDLASAPAENTLKLRMGAGRPYVSATKQFKPLGFTPAAGSTGLDIEAKPYGTAGFEFRLPL